MLCLAFALLSATAQTDRQYIRKGNAAFADRKYGVAEVNFRKALAANAHNAIAAYNLGCAMQAQHKDSLALQNYKERLPKSHRSLQECTAKQSPSRQRTLQSYTVHAPFKEATAAAKEQ